jgi:type I restriction enzyme M protein
MAQNFSELANFVWSVADLLRGDYKQALRQQWGNPN